MCDGEERHNNALKKHGAAVDLQTVENINHPNLKKNDVVNIFCLIHPFITSNRRDIESVFLFNDRVGMFS